MTKLFNLDIAQIVADAIEKAGDLQEGSLAKGDATHTFQGFVAVREFRRPDTLIVESVPVLSILGASVKPAAVPAINDVATIAGITYELVRLVRRDPVSALYEFEVR